MKREFGSTMFKPSKTHRYSSQDDWNDKDSRGREKKSRASYEKTRNVAKQGFKKAIVESNGKVDDDSIYNW